MSNRLEFLSRDFVDICPRFRQSDHFGSVKVDDALGKNAVVTVTNAADRQLNTILGQALVVTD